MEFMAFKTIQRATSCLNSCYYKGHYLGLRVIKFNLGLFFFATRLSSDSKQQAAIIMYIPFSIRGMLFGCKATAKHIKVNQL